MNEPTSDVKPSTPRRGGPAPAGWIKLVTCGTANEAELIAAVLWAHGIQSHVFGTNINSVDWLWQVFNDVDLIVQETDLERAKEALSRASLDDVEPAEEPADAPPPTDSKGRPLVPVAAFDNRMDLRDAQTLLASERIAAYAPRLVLRGDRPAGTGNRFILRVTEENLEKARSLLAEQTAEERDQPRCPRCGSWRVMVRKSILSELARVTGLGGPDECICLSCQFHGSAQEFMLREDEGS